MIKMQKTIISLSIILIGSILANTSHAFRQTDKFHDWIVAVNGQNCIAIHLENPMSEIKVLFDKGKSTPDVHFREFTAGEMGGILKVKFDILGGENNYQFNMFSMHGRGYSNVADSNAPISIISAFRKSSEIKANWSVGEGDNFSSSFSLMGFNAAFLKAAEQCGSEKFVLTTAPEYQAKNSFIKDVLSKLSPDQLAVIAVQLNTYTSGSQFEYNNLSFSGTAPRLWNSLKEYSQKFMVQNDGFNSINSKDSAKRFFMSIVEQGLEREAKEKEKEKAAFDQKLKAHELKIMDKNTIGFRDFYVGMDLDMFTFFQHGIRPQNPSNQPDGKCIEAPYSLRPNSMIRDLGYVCYGLDYVFNFRREKNILKHIRIYVLNYVKSSASIGNLFDFVSDDPLVGLIYSLNKKYKKSYSYSEHQRLLFNDGETDKLYIAYEDGQVILSLEHVDDDDDKYDTDIHVYITYRNKSDGLKFLDTVKPKTATSDF